MTSNRATRSSNAAIVAGAVFAWSAFILPTAALAQAVHPDSCPQPDQCGGGGTTDDSGDGADIIPPKAYTMTPTGINISDGSFTLNATDLSIGSLSLERFYSGGSVANLDADDKFFGLHASSNFDIFVNPVFGKEKIGFFPQHAKPIVHLGMAASGMYAQYQYTGTVASIDPEDFDANSGVLGLLNNAYVYTDSSGTTYTFNPSIQVAGAQGDGVYAPYSQRVASIAFANGRMQNLSYVNGALKLVTDSSGYAIVFDYIDYVDPSINRTRHLTSDACAFDLSQTYVTTSSTCAGASLKVSYSYSGSELVSVTDVMGQLTTYQYASAAGVVYMSCVKPPPGTGVCQISNLYPDSQNLTQTLADGSVWKVSWGQELVEASNEQVLNDGNNLAVVTDPGGGVGHYSFTGTSPYHATDAMGNSSSYLYEGGQDEEIINPPPIHFGSRLLSATLPDGEQYVPYNNGPFNMPYSITLKAKPGSGLSDRVTQYTYNAGSGFTLQTWPKPVTKIDPNNNETDWAYYSWGGTQWEMDPPPAAGGARPLKLYLFEQKYAYIKDTNGNLIAESTPIWMPASETDCQTVAGSSTPTCDASAPQEVITYEYGADGTADNLLLRGKVETSGGVSLRTCYGYDQYSNKISETAPRANLASCS
jgi:hypothetical protein